VAAGEHAEAEFMQRALELAARDWADQPEPGGGSRGVADGLIVGEGWHAKAGEPHAEPLALAAAGARARGRRST